MFVKVTGVHKFTWCNAKCNQVTDVYIHCGLATLYSILNHPVNPCKCIVVKHNYVTCVGAAMVVIYPQDTVVMD